MKKLKEKSDKYYLEKYNLTEEQLADYKRKKEEIGDPDLIIEDLIDPQISLGLSLSAKISFLEKLRNRVLTVLFLVEKNKENPETNPDNYLLSLLMDVHAANLLFDEQLVDIYVKLYGISKMYKESALNVIRKQVLETRRLVDDLLKKLTGDCENHKSEKDGNKK